MSPFHGRLELELLFLLEEFVRLDLEPENELLELRPAETVDRELDREEGCDATLDRLLPDLRLLEIRLDEVELFVLRPAETVDRELEREEGCDATLDRLPLGVRFDKVERGADWELDLGTRTLSVREDPVFCLLERIRLSEEDRELRLFILSPPVTLLLDPFLIESRDVVERSVLERSIYCLEVTCGFPRTKLLSGILSDFPRSPGNGTLSILPESLEFRERSDRTVRSPERTDRSSARLVSLRLPVCS